jgi:hypothetical protein
MRLRGLLYTLLVVGGAIAAPTGGTNSVSIWNSITSSAIGEVSSLCKSFLYGASPFVITVFKTVSQTTTLETTVVDGTETVDTTVQVPFTVLTTIQTSITTYITDGITTTKTIPYLPPFATIL